MTRHKEKLRAPNLMGSNSSLVWQGSKHTKVAGKVEKLGKKGRARNTEAEKEARGVTGEVNDYFLPPLSCFPFFYWYIFIVHSAVFQAS